MHVARWNSPLFLPPLARCWVVDRVDTWAVVLFVDFGQSATVPVQCLRSLDSDDFWTIPPLTQPFMLRKGKMPFDPAPRPPGSGLGDAVSAPRTSAGEGVGAAKALRVPLSL